MKPPFGLKPRNPASHPGCWEPPRGRGASLDACAGSSHGRGLVSLRTRAVASVFAVLGAAAALGGGGAAAGPTVSVEPRSAHPGDVVFLRVEGAARPPEGTFGKRPLAFYAYG